MKNKNDIKNKIDRMIKIYPFYGAISMDFPFWVALFSIWMIEVKGVKVIDIAMIETISAFIMLIIVAIVRKNTAGRSALFITRIGHILSILSVLAYIFGNSIVVFVIAGTCYVTSLMLTNMNSVTLQHSLEYVHKEKEFVRIQSRVNMGYSIITMSSALLLPFVFSLNPYLPLILDGVIKIVALVLTFFLVEAKGEDEETIEENIKITETFKHIFNKKSIPITILILIYGVMITSNGLIGNYAIIHVQELLSDILKPITLVSVIAGIKIANRLCRLVSSFFYPKIDKYFNKNILEFIIKLALAVAVVIFLGTFDINVYVSVIMVTLGFLTIPFLRQSITISFKEKLFLISRKELYKDLMLGMEFTGALMKFILTGLLTLILYNTSMTGVYLGFSILLLLMLVLYKKFLKGVITK